MLQVTINTEVGNLAGPYEIIATLPESEARAEAERYAHQHDVTGGCGCVVMVGEPGSLPTQGFTTDKGWMTGGFRPTVSIPGTAETAPAG